MPANFQYDFSGIDASVGDKIKLTDGRQGYIRFWGDDPKNEGNPLLGIELTAPDYRSGGDGSYGGQQFFKVDRAKTGYFLNAKNFDLIETFVKVKKQQVTGMPEARIGDKIKLKDGRTGVIRYFGKDPDRPEQPLIGLEMLQPDLERGTDGTYKNGVRYFKAPKYKGLFLNVFNFDQIESFIKVKRVMIPGDATDTLDDVMGNSKGGDIKIQDLKLYKTWSDEARTAFRRKLSSEIRDYLENQAFDDDQVDKWMDEIAHRAKQSAKDINTGDFKYIVDVCIIEKKKGFGKSNSYYWRRKTDFSIKFKVSCKNMKCVLTLWALKFEE